MNEIKDGKSTLKPQEINLNEYWRIVNKRRWMIAAFALVVLAGAAFKTFTAMPVYTAKGTLLIEKEPNILTFQDMFQIESFRDDYYQTQYKLLQSYALAERTVDKLGLAEKKARELNSAPANHNGRPVDPKNPGFIRGLAESLMGGIKVTPIRMTRLVDIAYSDPDPNMAADIVNALFEAFVDMSIEAKYAATEQASEFLSTQIKSLKKEIDSAQQEIQKYGAEKNIVALSDKETTTIEKLGALNSALTEAMIDRIKKETYFNEVKIASPDYIPETMGNQLIQRLRETYVGLSRDYQKKAETYKPDYPEMVRLKSELDTTRAALEAETQSFIKGTYSDFQAALKKEQSLTQVFNNQKQEALLLNSNAIAYNSLKIEIDNKKNMLESLMKRLSETDVSARLRGLRTSNVRVVDPARVPVAPSSPNKQRNLLLALFLGLFGGIGLAFLMEYLDNSVKTSEDVERSADLPTLGIIPEFSKAGYKKGYGYGYGYGYGQGGGKERKRKKEEIAEAGVEERKTGKENEIEAEKKKPITHIELITHYAPKSNFSESYRSLRTAFLLSSAGPSRKTVLITSALPSEGKSANICNFAVTLAQNNKRVLIIDADLRKPRQHRIFGIKNLNGLTNCLTIGAEFKDLIKPTTIKNLFLINSGPLPPNPAELLGSERMAALLSQLKHSVMAFDYIVIDTPPILAVTDALVVAPHTDGVILIVWSGKTSRESLRIAKEKLDLMNIKTMGVVLNHLNVRDLGYYYKHYHYHYRESGAGGGARA